MNERKKKGKEGKRRWRKRRGSEKKVARGKSARSLRLGESEGRGIGRD